MKVLFAVDGTTGCDAAVRQGGQLLNAQTDDVALYFALPEVTVRHASSNEAMRDRARRAIADAVFEQAKLNLPDGLGRKAEVVTDEHLAADGILRAVDANGAELLVIGACGLGTVDRFLLGSVSRGVVQAAKVPVLVVRPNPEHRKNQPLRILVAYDGSASCTTAIGAAARLSLPANTEVIAATVVEPLTVGKVPDWIINKARDADTEAMVQTWQREHESDKRQARDQLAEFMAKQPGPFAKAEVVVCEGNAAEQILGVAEERQVDLIVMGTHGMGLIQRFLIGSTSDKVLNYAPCSVLLARD
jgi:nucleotide-binding universal stress UspA family protein